MTEGSEGLSMTTSEGLRVTGYRDAESDIKNCPVFHALRNKKLKLEPVKSSGISSLPQSEA